MYRESRNGRWTGCKKPGGEPLPDERVMRPKSMPKKETSGIGYGIMFTTVTVNIKKQIGAKGFKRVYKTCDKTIKYTNVTGGVTKL